MLTTEVLIAEEKVDVKAATAAGGYGGGMGGQY